MKKMLLIFLCISVVYSTLFAGNWTVEYESYTGSGSGYGASWAVYGAITSGPLIRIPETVSEYGSTYRVKAIKRDAASGNSVLTGIEFPSSLEEIRVYAFDKCTNLSTITFKDGAAHLWILSYAFRECTSLKSVVFPDTPLYIGTDAFYGCTSLMDVEFPEVVTGIDSYAFYKCPTKMTFLFSGEPPQNVGTSAFPNATGYYLPEYAKSWEAVIDADGKWNGLTMNLKKNKTSVIVTTIGEGSVTGAGEYLEGEAVTLTATADEGSIFCGWDTKAATMASVYTFTMPQEAVTVTAYFASKAALDSYVRGKELMTAKEAIEKALEANEVFTKDEMKSFAFGAPVIEVKEGAATVGISVMKASSVDGEWEVIELDSNATAVESDKIQVTVPADEKAAFYKFVVPENQ